MSTPQSNFFSNNDQGNFSLPVVSGAPFSTLGVRDMTHDSKVRLSNGLETRDMPFQSKNPSFFTSGNPPVISPSFNLIPTIQHPNLIDVPTTSIDIKPVSLNQPLPQTKNRRKKNSQKPPEQASIDELKEAYEKVQQRKAQQHNYYLERKQKLQSYDELQAIISQLQTMVFQKDQQIQSLSQQLSQQQVQSQPQFQSPQQKTG